MSVKGLLYNLVEFIAAALFGALFGLSFLFAIVYFEEDIFKNSYFWNVASALLGAVIGTWATSYLASEGRKSQIKLSAKVAAANLDYYLNDMSSISIKLLTLEQATDPILDSIPILDLHSVMRCFDEQIITLNNDSARLLKEDIIELTRKLELAKIKIIEYINFHNEISDCAKHSHIKCSDTMNALRAKNSSAIISLVDSARDKLAIFSKKFL